MVGLTQEGRGRHSTWAIGLGLLAGLAVAGGRTQASSDEAPPLWTEAHSASPPVEPLTFFEANSDFCALAAKTCPAVVTIQSTRRPLTPAEALLPEDLRRLFPNSPRDGMAQGTGSGFLIHSDGWIVTNQHMVAGALALHIRLADGSPDLPARLVGQDEHFDLALLKVESERPLPVLPLGRSADLAIGAWVVAIGNPLGLNPLVTKGILSGKGRHLDDLPDQPAVRFDYLQTDAALDRGNSGGPLLNLRGEVVGINTAVNTQVRGIGFAIPVDVVKAVVPHLLHHGRVRRAYLGFAVDPLDFDQARSLGLTRVGGGIVRAVKPDGPADKAGLQPGDVLLAFGGESLSGFRELSWRIATAWRGRPVALAIWRAGHSQVVSVVPCLRPSESSGMPIQETKPIPSAQAASSQRRMARIEVAALDEASCRTTGLPFPSSGVVVLGVPDEAIPYGLRLGDVILEIDDRPVTNPAEFSSLLDRISPGAWLRLAVLRQHRRTYFALPKRWPE